MELLIVQLNNRVRIHEVSSANYTSRQFCLEIFFYASFKNYFD